MLHMRGTARRESVLRLHDTMQALPSGQTKATDGERSGEVQEDKPDQLRQVSSQAYQEEHAMNERALKAENLRLKKDNTELRRKISALEKENRNPQDQPEVTPSYTGTTESGWTPEKQAKLEASDPFLAHVMQQRRRKRSWLDS